MAIRVYKPTSPARRFMSVLTYEEITTTKPEKSLLEYKKKNAGRKDKKIIEVVLAKDGVTLITADHGNDPTWRGTDHTRERVPVLGWGLGVRAVGQVGYADVGASIAAHLGLPPAGAGQSFLD